MLHRSIEECENENYFSYFSTKTYDLGTQINQLSEMALLITQNTGDDSFQHQKHMLKLRSKKYFQIYAQKHSLSKPMWYHTVFNLEIKGFPKSTMPLA